MSNDAHVAAVHAADKNPMQLTSKHIVAFFMRAAERIHEQRDELSELDAAIGDGDHGANLDRGFAAIVARLAHLDETDIGAILKLAGTTLTSTVGGAAGPLYGTAFVRAGAALARQTEADGQALARALGAAREGVVARGKAQPGDKTMLDALDPGVNAFCAAIDAGATLPEATQAMLSAVEAGVRATIPMLAKKGRASYLGERSMGHQDPGATSTWYLLQALHDVIVEHRA